MRERGRNENEEEMGEREGGSAETCVVHVSSGDLVTVLALIKFHMVGVKTDTKTNTM